MHVPELYWLQVPFFVTIKNAEMLFQINVYIFYTSPRKAIAEPHPPLKTNKQTNNKNSIYIFDGATYYRVPHHPLLSKVCLFVLC